jgi:PAS domain S-box-containing protein
LTQPAGDGRGFDAAGEAPAEDAPADRPHADADDLFRFAFELASTGGALTAPDGRLLRVNRKMREMLGYSAEELTRRSFADITHPDDLAASREVVRCLLAGERNEYRLEKRYVRKDGTTLWADVSTTLLRDPEGRPAHFVTSVIDAGDRKRAEEVLARSEAKARALYHRLPLPTLVWERRDGRFVLADFNERASAITRDGVRTWLGKALDEVCADRPDIVADVDRAYRERTSFTREMDYHYRTTAAARRLRVTYGHVEPDMVLVHTEDVTEQRRIEEQSRAAQKMEAIGQLAGGLAHDFNNLMSVVLGYAAFAREGLREGDPLLGDLEEIERAGRRAAELTGQLLAFSRKQVLQPEVIDLNAVTVDLERMLCRLLGESVEIVLRPGPGLGRVKIDPGRIEQVIVNLAVNARDAMPGGGTLTIETANLDVDEAFAEAHPGLQPGPHVMLAVSDNGCGMAPEIRGRIFDPFFSTKPVGKGTGLGLATVYGIVRQSGGSIRVHSEIGEGTTFRLYFPRTDEPAEPPQAHRPSDRPATGSETILVVEDEEGVRGLSARVLRGAGYTVLTASGGGEALLVAEEYRGPIHLLLTDVVMPRMGGRRLAKRLQAFRPSMRVLYMSGHAENEVVDRGLILPGTAFIAKPLCASDLARKVRDVLDATPDRPADAAADGGGRTR